ncbi:MULTISPECIES: TIGR02270 family protein [Myxococcus]|uniref:TIGR02270 family protein n=1 Tax=Myxococcus TaxID=32 RepID=UPI001143A820|nr:MULTISPECIES: TIGR02270 family protein [Myxococcus]NOK02302.1 TIGR02270 family protein [Myxococcus xanthus]
MILWDILEEHLNEAAFLWGQWERSLRSPRYVLREVIDGPEERLLAHVEGLREGGALTVERLLRPALEEEEAGLFCAAAFTLLSDSTAAHLDTLLEGFDEASEQRQSCIRRVLELGGGEALTARLEKILTEGTAPASVLATALDAVSLRQPHPRVELKPFLSSAVPRLQAAALRAVGRWLSPLDTAAMARSLDSPDATVRDAALVAGLLLGRRAAWSACRHFVDARAPAMARTALLVAMGGQPKDIEMLTNALGTPELQGDMLRALGTSGSPAAVEACLPLLRNPKVAHLAAEAIATITGLVVEGPFRREAPNNEGDEDDAPLIPAPEDELPFPDHEAVEAWWKEQRKRFMPGTRYLHGQPVTAALILEALHQAPMSRRHALALNVAIRSKGAVRLNPDGFAQEQWAQVSRLRPASVSHPFQPFSDFAQTL